MFKQAVAVKVKRWIVQKGNVKFTEPYRVILKASATNFQMNRSEFSRLVHKNLKTETR